MKKDPRKEVLALWKLRSKAEKKAREGGNKDLGLRAGVTSGRHLDPLSELVRGIFIDAGMPPDSVHCGGVDLQIPGFYRPQKKWDVVVVHQGVLVAAVEFKSILGSHGNNMNNRTEESLGNATDLLEAAEQVMRPWKRGEACWMCRSRPTQRMLLVAMRTDLSPARYSTACRRSMSTKA
jgi:hypothetical protein